MDMVFVVGNSRSGTTLLGKILGNHSQVFTFNELQFFENDVDAAEMVRSQIARERLVLIGERLLARIEDGVFSTVTPKRNRGRVEALIDRENLQDPMALYATILAMKTREAGKTISCEQTPRYLFVLDALLDAYPEARAIHIYRDPRAVLLSQKFRWKRASLSDAPRRSRLWTLTAWSNYHPIVTSLFWASAMRKARHFSDHPRVTEIAYEALLAEPERTMSEVCRFLGLRFDPAMLDVPVEGSSTRHDAPDRRGIDQSRIDSWRDGGLTSAEIAICESISGSEMRRRGYELTGMKASLLQRGLSYGSLLIKTVAAIALNSGRFSNIFAFLWRRLQ